MTQRSNVLIAGAGPVGLTMANELTRYGIAVRIIDKAAQRTDKSKALVLWSRTLELFDQAGYADEFLSAGMAAHGAEISNGKEVLARVSFDGVESRHPYALMIPQSDTERILEERLEGQGVKVERTVTLEKFTDLGPRVEAVVRGADGESETPGIDWLIGCDGAHSIVRHGLGLAFEGTTEPSDWYLADGHIAGLEPHDRLHIFWHKDGILAFFPITDGRWRVVADLGPARDDGHHPDPTLEEVQALMTARGSKAVMRDPYWLASFRINERKVARYGQGRVFLAGDAAHIHSPAGGQGMNTGMQDAFNLAWKLSLVIRGVCKPALLDSYSIERSAVGDMVLRNAGRLTEAAIMRNPIAQGLRNAVVKFALGFPQLEHRAADTLAELDISYPDSPLTVNGGHHPRNRKAGERWPERLPSSDGKARFTALGPGDAVAELAKEFSQLVQGIPTSSGDLRVIRPDGYIGFASAASDCAGAMAYLEALAAT
ncbi:FAD-dependent monooxygenase [Reyranella sp.]|jgi:2-polyprenyl-6-methoxyphenol hydroxylase-like FAD-dependent oxidoreductase|uniref:FAD-dependent monooxygenase n=1 Tax=Reyranella sp. TaxID=1929291 RepID=UPI002F957932